MSTARATASVPPSTPELKKGETAPLSPLEKISRLLDEGKFQQAHALIVRDNTSAPAMRNALGVCLMRQGALAEAIKLYRGFVLTGSGLILRSDLPTIYRANYATALLMQGEVAGCISVLNELNDDQHPSVQRLRDAIAKWKKTLSFGKRLNWVLGIPPVEPVPIDFIPGDLG